MEQQKEHEVTEEEQEAVKEEEQRDGRRACVSGGDNVTTANRLLINGKVFLRLCQRRRRRLGVHLFCTCSSVCYDCLIGR